jgi:HSP20 family molecular chaperone IbpA
MVIDIVAAGYGKEDITVATALKDGGKHFLLTVKGKYTRPTGATGKAVPRFGYDKVIDEKFKVVQELPLENDYNLDAIKWGVRNGVIRISIPKTPAAVGKAVAAFDGNVNAVENEADDE